MKPQLPALQLIAGVGERLRPLTLQFPKPCLPFLNLPILDYGMYWLKQMGATQLVCNLHHLKEIGQNYASHESQIAGLPVDFSDETEQILGSAGAIFHAESKLASAENFIYMNGDEVMLPSSNNIPLQLVTEHQRHKSLATIFVTKHPEVGKKFGAVLADANGIVRGFARPPLNAAILQSAQHGPLTPYHFTGLQIISKEIFQYRRKGVSNIFYDIFLQAIQDGHTIRIFCDDKLTWFETGNPADFLSATEIFLQALALRKSSFDFNLGWLNQTHKLFRPSSDLQKQLHLEPDSIALMPPTSKVDKKIKVSGFLVAEENISIEATGSKAELHNVILINKNKKPTAFVCDQKIQNQILIV